MNHLGLIVGERRALNNWVRQFRTILDIKNGSYKIQESLFNTFKWGDSKSLPKIDYVLIFRTLFAKCEDCEIGERDNNIHSYFQVSLVHHKNRRLIVHETKSKEEALNVAKEIAESLSTRLKDAATETGTPVWLI